MGLLGHETESMFTRHALNDVPALERAIVKLATLDSKAHRGGRYEKYEGVLPYRCVADLRLRSGSESVCGHARRSRHHRRILAGAVARDDLPNRVRDVVVPAWDLYLRGSQHRLALQPRFHPRRRSMGRTRRPGERSPLKLRSHRIHHGERHRDRRIRSVALMVAAPQWQQPRGLAH